MPYLKLQWSIPASIPWNSIHPAPASARDAGSQLQEATATAHGCFTEPHRGFSGRKPPGRSLTSSSAQHVANRIPAHTLAGGQVVRNAIFLGNGQEKGDPGGGFVLGFQLQSPAHPTSLALASTALLQCRGLCLAWKPLAVLIIRLSVCSVVLPPLCTPQTIVCLCH